jgi:hypothetical protein
MHFITAERLRSARMLKKEAQLQGEDRHNNKMRDTSRTTIEARPVPSGLYDSIASSFKRIGTAGSGEQSRCATGCMKNREVVRAIKRAQAAQRVPEAGIGNARCIDLINLGHW